MIRIYAIRHGETDGNKAGVLQGWTDTPLNEKGKELAVITARALCDVKFDLVYSSPLRRAYETAEIMLRYNNHPSPAIETDDRLKEIYFGEWEGAGITSENFSVPSDNFNTFYTNPFAFQNAPSGESLSQVCQRTADFYEDLISNPLHEGKTLLVSTHGFAVRAFLHNVYEDKSDFWHGQIPDNCAINIIEVENGKAVLTGDDLVFYDKSLCINPYHKLA